MNYTVHGVTESDTTERLSHIVDITAKPGNGVEKREPSYIAGGNAADLGSLPGSGRSPEKEMATQSSVLAWRLLWTGEPGELESTGPQRAGHDE